MGRVWRGGDSTPCILHMKATRATLVYTFFNTTILHLLQHTTILHLPQHTNRYYTCLTAPPYLQKQPPPQPLGPETTRVEIWLVVAMHRGQQGPPGQASPLKMCHWLLVGWFVVSMVGWFVVSMVRWFVVPMVGWFCFGVFLLLVGVELQRLPHLCVCAWVCMCECVWVCMCVYVCVPMRETGGEHTTTVHITVCI